MLELRHLLGKSRGFTLIELMVTVSIAAILMMVAVPSMTTFMRNSQLTSFSNTLLAAINAARGEAMKRGRYAMVVPADNANWSSGWIVFVDTYPLAAPNKSYDAGHDVLIISHEASPSYITISANGAAAESPPYIMFDASGYAKTKAGGFGALTFEVSRNDVANTDQIRRLKIASTGRARICTPSSTTDTTCSASATY
jgi:type IV fimbrial biogenesis protein FimT